MSNTAFVIGNGISRKNIKLKHLKKLGTTYGCNALYRDFTPDFLVSVDTKMIKEIIDSGYNEKNQVWVNINSFTKKLKKINFLKPNLGWSSGPSALFLASKNNHEKIYILGFDYTGIGIQKKFVNNVYTGTKNYKDPENKAIYYGNWVKQTATIIRDNPEIKYYRVVENNSSFVPDELKLFPNLLNITVDEFKNSLNINKTV